MEQTWAGNGLHEGTRKGYIPRSEWVRRQGLEPRTRRLRVCWSYFELMRSSCYFMVLPAEICGRFPGLVPVRAGCYRAVPGHPSNHGHDRLWVMNDRPAVPDGAAGLPLGPGGGYGLLFLLVAGESGLVVPVDSMHTIPLLASVPSTTTS